TKYIKSTTKGNATAIIALTASVLEEEKAITLSAGCDDFMRKPFKESVIFDILTKHLGVKYIYEEETTETEGEQKTEKPLNPEQLKIKPTEWQLKLHQRAMEGDDDEMIKLIQEIPPTETTLIKSLNKLVHQYQFQQIINLIKPLINHE
ncbi:MAG TPA: histidine kinase, partial [Allocoleopsis sp.]